ncbi:MAG TPA: sulfite exporter TauE/SafE family protein [Candidatus Nitrosotalea sp.]|nr:sulfite exporter TauE/SafE family protein [Candidatus Nitrosotalea sp.]
MALDILTVSMLGIIGLGIGFVGGLVGLVLGVVRFPLILGASGTTVAISAGTNIGISTLGAFAAAIGHFRQNNVHRRIFLIMAITGATGAFVGSFLTRFVPVIVLLLSIGVIVLYESFSLIKSSRKVQGQDLKPSATTTLPSEAAIGFSIGFIGGLVGLVLGSIRVPAMISVLKMEPRVAVGTNLAASSIIGTAGLLGHVINNEVDFQIFVVMGCTAMVGGYIGSRFTNRFNAETLKMMIGIVLAFVAIVIFLRAALYF